MNFNKINQAMKHKDIFKAGAKKRKLMNLTPQENFTTIMKEFKRGTLYSGSGKKVKNQAQAVAVAFSTSKKRGK